MFSSRPVSTGTFSLSGEQASLLIRGRGVMADLIRSHRWESTSVGPIESWPVELIMAVNMMLASKAVVTIYWGPERLMIYNDSYVLQLGDRHPALGQRLAEVWPEVNDEVESILGSTFETGESSFIEHAPFEILHEGQMIERTYTLMTDPIWCQTSRGPEILGLYHTAIDQTEAVRARQEKDRVTEQLTQVLEATTDAIVGVDRQWKMTYLNANAERLYGASDRLVGRKVWDAFPEAVYEGSPFVEHYERAMNEGVSGSFEAHYADPLNIWIRLEVYPTSEGIVTVSRDISEQKRTTAALMQTEKLAAVGRLAASIAHEINNPLESVTNLLYLVRHSEEVPAIHEYIDVAERELRRVSLIANQTLRFHRQSTRPVAVFCYDLIGDSLSIYQGRLVNSRIQVEKRKRAEHPVDCFDGEIRQVLSNLIGNAIDAMPAGGRLLVRSREATRWATGDKGLVITVADTGSGISAETQLKIFEPFFTTKGIGGTGLGLWVSSEIVARHRGTMKVRSSTRPENSGTVFTLFLPFEAARR